MEHYCSKWTKNALQIHVKRNRNQKSVNVLGAFFPCHLFALATSRSCGGFDPLAIESCYTPIKTLFQLSLPNHWKIVQVPFFHATIRLVFASCLGRYHTGTKIGFVSTFNYSTVYHNKMNLKHYNYYSQAIHAAIKSILTFIFNSNYFNE